MANPTSPSVPGSALEQLEALPNKWRTRRAHTNASENADLYRGFDNGAMACAVELAPIAAAVRQSIETLKDEVEGEAEISNERLREWVALEEQIKEMVPVALYVKAEAALAAMTRDIQEVCDSSADPVIAVQAVVAQSVQRGEKLIQRERELAAMTAERDRLREKTAREAAARPLKTCTCFEIADSYEVDCPVHGNTNRPLKTAQPNERACPHCQRVLKFNEWNGNICPHCDGILAEQTRRPKTAQDYLETGGEAVEHGRIEARRRS